MTPDSAFDELVSQFWKCPSCAQVFPAKDGNYIYLDLPSPCCGASGEPRGMWPQADALSFFLIAERQLQDDDGLRVATLLLAAGCENMLRTVIWEVLGRMETQFQIAEALMGKQRGRYDLLQLYRTLTRASAKNVLQEAGLPGWMAAWDALTKARNSFAHGQWYSHSPIEPALVEEVQRGAIPAFVALHNASGKPQPPADPG